MEDEDTVVLTEEERDKIMEDLPKEIMDEDEDEDED